MSQLKKLLNVEDVANLTGMSEDWVYRKAREGVIPRVKLPGTRVRFRPDDIETFIATYFEPGNDRFM